MLFKTIAFIIMLYLLVKVISRLFLPSGARKQGKARVFYRMYRNIRDQQKNQGRNRQNASGPQKFEEIEEAEYEEIEEDREENK